MNRTKIWKDVVVETGVTKNLAVYNKGNCEYMKDSEGNVYKFIFGVMDTKTPYNYLSKVGNVKASPLPNDFESKEYDGFSPLRATLYPMHNGFYLFEH